MLGYATANDASANATFLFDDIKQESSTLSEGDFQSLNVDKLITYPNPAREVVTISSKIKNIKTITLFDILGQQIKVVQADSQEVTIDVAHLASGLYMAKVLTETGVGSIKLIVN